MTKTVGTTRDRLLTLVAMAKELGVGHVELSNAPAELVAECAGLLGKYPWSYESVREDGVFQVGTLGQIEGVGVGVTHTRPATPEEIAAEALKGCAVAEKPQDAPEAGVAA